MRIESINQKTQETPFETKLARPSFSTPTIGTTHWHNVVCCLEFGVVINFFSDQRGRRGRNRAVTLTCVEHTLTVSCRCCYCGGSDCVKWLNNSSSVLHQLVNEMTDRNASNSNNNNTNPLLDLNIAVDQGGVGSRPMPEEIDLRRRKNHFLVCSYSFLTCSWVLGDFATS